MSDNWGPTPTPLEAEASDTLSTTSEESLYYDTAQNKVPLPDSISTMPDSDDYNLTLVCQGQEFTVHKTYACIQSPVIAAACNTTSNFREATSNVIQVNEFDPQTVKYMVEFLCKGSYKVPDPGMSTPMPEILRPHILVNSIADYYNISKLLKQTNRRVKYALWRELSPKDFVEVVKFAAERTTDSELYRTLVQGVAQFSSELVDDQDFKELECVNWFTLDLIKGLNAYHNERCENLESEFLDSESKVDELECKVRDQEYELGRSVDRESELESENRFYEQEYDRSRYRIKDLECEVERSCKAEQRVKKRYEELDYISDQCLEFSKGDPVCATCMQKLRDYLEAKEAVPLQRCPECCRT